MKALTPDSTVPTWTGVVRYLHICPKAYLPMHSFTELTFIAGQGIEGDRYSNDAGYYSNKPEEGRQVTLFEIESLEALERELGIELLPGEHRRNVTVQGVPLNHLVNKQFWLGNVLLEATRLSNPCKHLEDLTEKPVFNGLVHRAGLNCKIIRGGVVNVGDAVYPAR